jgi:hypothetical protein
MTRYEAQASILADLRAHVAMHVKFPADPTLRAVAVEMLARIDANQPLAVDFAEGAKADSAKL